MTCPICAKDSKEKYRPFCSKHCADIDLGKWLTGAYAVHSQEEPDEELAQALQDEARKTH